MKIIYSPLPPAGEGMGEGGGIVFKLFPKALDSGFRQNDEERGLLKFVSPAKAGVQSIHLKRPDPKSIPPY